jgi:hypothetical protein
MRWFVSFFMTLIVVAVTAAILWLRTHTLFGVQELSDAVVWLVPRAAAAFLERYQVTLMFLLYALILSITAWILAYTASATDAAPRARPGTRASFGNAAYSLFHNPARWWLTAFVLLIGIATAASGTYLWLFGGSVFADTAWGVTALFGCTLMAAMVTPDGADPLRARPDPFPDPRLGIPGESTEATGAG